MLNPAEDLECGIKTAQSQNLKLNSAYCLRLIERLLWKCAVRKQHCVLTHTCCEINLWNNVFNVNRSIIFVLKYSILLFKAASAQLRNVFRAHISAESWTLSHPAASWAWINDHSLEPLCFWSNIQFFFIVIRVWPVWLSPSGRNSDGSTRIINQP